MTRSRLFSLQSLREHLDIQSADATHGTMSDVDLLRAILKRMTVDMKLTITDFVEKSFEGFRSHWLEDQKEELKLATYFLAWNCLDYLFSCCVFTDDHGDNCHSLHQPMLCNFVFVFKAVSFSVKIVIHCHPVPKISVNVLDGVVNSLYSAITLSFH